MNPFFTIIVPTLDRGLTLADCLLAIDSQDFEDYEVIVSDNCSADKTPEIVQEAIVRNPRVKYVRPPAQLPMSLHWEFAYEHAKGKYICFLGDDDAIAPYGLSTAYEILREFQETTALNSVNVEFHWPNSPIQHHQSLIRIPIGERWVQERDCLEMLRLIKTHGRLYIELPMVYRGFVCKDALDNLVHRTGRLICSSIPDVYLAIAVASTTKNFLFTNRPLFVEGISGKSNGAAAAVGSLDNDTLFFIKDCIPFHPKLNFSATPAFLHAESLLQCFDAKIIGEELTMSPEDIVSHAAVFSASLPPSRYDQTWVAIQRLSDQYGLSQLIKDLKQKYPNTPLLEDPFPSDSVWIDTRNVYEPGLAVRADSFGVSTVSECVEMLKSFFPKNTRPSLSVQMALALFESVKALKMEGIALHYSRHELLLLNAHAEEVRRKLSIKLNEIADLQSDLSRVNGAAVDLENSLSNAVNELKKSLEVIDESRTQLRDMKGRLDGAENELHRTRKQLDHARQRLIATNRKLEKTRIDRDELRNMGTWKKILGFFGIKN